MNLKHETNRIMGGSGMETETLQSEVEAILSDAERRAERSGYIKGFVDGKIAGYDMALEELAFEALIKRGSNDNG